LHQTGLLKETVIGRKYLARKRDRQQPIIKGVDEMAKTARRPRHDFEEWLYLNIGKEWIRGLVGIG
jgi:hypothetical protein